MVAQLSEEAIAARDHFLKKMHDREPFYATTSPSGELAVTLFKAIPDETMRKLYADDMLENHRPAHLAKADPYTVMVRVTDKEGIK